MKSYEEQIKELKERLAKLEAEQKESKEKSKRWKPEIGDLYCYINKFGTVDYEYWSNDDADNFVYLTHNCFKTQEEAKERKEEIETYYKFKNFIEEHSELLDWNNINQKKYCCCYVVYAKKFYYDYVTSFKCQGAIYASSEQILKDAIDYIGGEEVAKRYLFGIKEQDNA